MLLSILAFLSICDCPGKYTRCARNLLSKCNSWWHHTFFYSKYTYLNVNKTLLNHILYKIVYTISNIIFDSKTSFASKGYILYMLQMV